MDYMFFWDLDYIAAIAVRDIPQAGDLGTVVNNTNKIEILKQLISANRFCRRFSHRGIL